MVRLALSYSAGVSSDLQLLAQGLPAGILVAAGDRIGEDREGDRPEAGEAGERLLFLRRGGPLLLLDVFEVRMAARMSRALAFSPLAIGTVGSAGMFGGERLGGLAVSARAGSVGPAASGVSFGSAGSGVCRPVWGKVIKKRPLVP